MLKFILKRIVIGVFIVFFGALVIYTIIRCLPNSFVSTMARQLSNLPGSKSYTELLEQLNVQFGFDKSIFEGFLRWLKDAVRGEFGYSWKYSRPVVDKFNDVIWYSVIINIITFIFQAVISIPLGILAARKQYSKTDYAVTVFALMGMSLPTFFLASLLKYVFSIKLGWFDLYGLVGRMHEQMTASQQLLDYAHHMVLPVVTLMILSVGGLMRYTRTNMLEVLNSDYIRTARAKGLPEKRVINEHAFRNTLIPLVSYMSYMLPNMFSGSIITETLYQIPGIGYIAYTSITAGDIPFTMFNLVFIEVLTQVSLIVADIMYAVVDPRVRIS